MSHPILYSFRRCPYAMRARLAVAAADITVELREVLLRDKPAAFLAASPDGTVPLLVTGDGVIPESLDIMRWALARRDPEGWLEAPGSEMVALITEADGPFKTALDRYKYHSRYAGADPEAERVRAEIFLRRLDTRLAGQGWLFGDVPCLADMAILPFVRQFALVDRAWFDAQPWPDLRSWLDRFLASARFDSIMRKYPAWQAGDPVTLFPEL